MAQHNTFWLALRFYIGNHLINAIPSFRVRHWYYRRVLGYQIGRASSIHMGIFFTGTQIKIGDNVVINRSCYLDGRIGIEIGDNVSISPKVYLVSMEHDPDSPTFDTRGKKIVIENDVWIGARVVVCPSVTIHNGAVIGAGAVVVNDILPYQIAVGNPARPIRERNRDLKYKCYYHTWFDTDIQQ